MIVDFHTHIFPDKIAAKTIEKLENIASVKAFTDGREQSLTASMQAAGVDLSVVLPVITRPEQFDTVNEFAMQLNEKYQQQQTRLLSFGGIHPDTLDFRRELRIIKKLGLLGIKLHPDYQNTYFDDIKYMRILDYASELGLISVVHVQPENLVLAHYGSFDLWQGVEELLVGENVYFDTAYTFGFIEDSTFLRILKNHGADKILFATDSPWSGQKESLEHLRKLGLAKEEQEQILGKNAQRLLGL